MRDCAACGREVPGDAAFCPWCGSAQISRCTQCGGDLPPRSAFCPACGTPVAVVPAAKPGYVDTEPEPASSGQRKLVTILFADLAGSTGLGEQMDPEQMREVMQRYFDAMREPIEAEGGTVEKFIGDAVMAAFGVPMAHEDDPNRALRATQGMRAALHDLNESLRAVGMPSLQIRIGINTGEVLAEVDPEPGEAMVTGDAVNVAARLQSAAQPGEVLVSERTSRSARGFSFGPSQSLQVRGRETPVVARPLTGGGATAERGVPGLWAPMVGRDSEMDLLNTLLRRVRTEQKPHLVTVYGEAGVGKSRLVREFVTAAAAGDEPPHVMQGRCLPYGNGVTFAPLAHIFKADAGIHDDDPAGIALQRVAETVTRRMQLLEGVDPAPVADAIAHTIGVPNQDSRIAELDPRLARQELLRAWAAYFTAVATAATTVMVIEDIHWAEPALLDLVEEVLEMVSGPLLLLCPSRPDLVGVRPSWGGGHRSTSSVALEPLSAQEAAALVAGLLTIEGLPVELKQTILERAEGNPFFLEEIVRQLIDRGDVRRVDDRWQAAPDISATHIPDTVQGVLSSRIDLLANADKRILQAAAVVGRTFWAGPLSQIARLDRSDIDGGVEAALWRLQDRELIMFRHGSALAGDAEFHFKHILTRDVAYESLPRRERALAHARAAQWIDSSAGDRSEEFAELLAHHYATAVELASEVGLELDPAMRANALEWLQRASAGACRKLVLGKAIRLAQRAAELAETDREKSVAHECLAFAYTSSVQGDDAFRHYLTASECAERSTEIADAKAADLLADAVEVPLRWVGTTSAEWSSDEVRSLCEHGLELAPGPNSRPRARLLAVLAMWPFAFPEVVESANAQTQGDGISEFMKLGEEAADLAAELGDVDVESLALDSVTSLNMWSADMNGALAVWQRRTQLLDRLTDLGEVMDVYAMGVWIHFERAEYQEAVDLADAAPGSEVTLNRIHADCWKLASLYRLGRWDQMKDLLGEIRAAFGQRTGGVPGFAQRGMLLAAAGLRLRGDPVMAEDLERACTPAAAAEPVLPTSVPRLGYRAHLRIASGDIKGAHELLATVDLGSYRNGHLAEGVGVLVESACDADLASRNWDNVDQLLDLAHQHERGGYRNLVAVARRLAGARALAQGDLAEAQDELRDSAQRFRDLSMPLDLSRSLSLLADVQLAAGNAAAAHGSEAEAQQLRETLGVRDDPLLRGARGATSG